MRINALSVANRFIQLSKRDGLSITQLGLMKRVYIAHGFSLALYGLPLLDERFDRVEAWKYGPVIPSVYHTFKMYQRNPITNLAVVAVWNEVTKMEDYEIPDLNDSRGNGVVEMVWKRYKDFSDSEMVELTHKNGTPWSLCYREGKSVEIPDEYTKLYYQKLVELTISRHQSEYQV